MREEDPWGRGERGHAMYQDDIAAHYKELRQCPRTNTKTLQTVKSLLIKTSNVTRTILSLYIYILA